VVAGWDSGCAWRSSTAPVPDAGSDIGPRTSGNSRAGPIEPTLPSTDGHGRAVRGAADIEREFRGFVIECCAEQGDQDTVGNSTPVPRPQYEDPAWDLGQIGGDRYDSTVNYDDDTQASNRYRKFEDRHRDRMAPRIAGSGSAKDRDCPAVWPRSPRRWVLAGLGIVCVGLAAVGVVVPGLPTTVFLIAASYLFTRSCPWLEDRLIRVRWFRPYLPYLDGSRPMPRRARLIAIGLMWSAVSVSLLVTAAAGRLRPWFAVTLVSAAAVGTWVIVRVRRAPAGVLNSDEGRPTLG
jgi:uncharacterized membrane protein YbaN (DUF454 family)